MVAARKKLVRKHAKLGAKHIGRMQWMAEAWQICRALDQLHADELAAERQDHLVRVRPMIDRQMVGALDVSDFASKAFGCAPMVKKNFAPKAWAERKRLPKFSGFDIRSAPMAKYPRILAPFRVKCGSDCRPARCAGRIGVVFTEVCDESCSMQVSRWPGCARDLRIPVSEPGRGEVAIRVSAVALNFFDTLIVRGKYQTKPELPFSPGGELAGTVPASGRE